MQEIAQDIDLDIATEEDVEAALRELAAGLATEIRNQRRLP